MTFLNGIQNNLLSILANKKDLLKSMNNYGNFIDLIKKASSF
jgi:hypothetical protein